MSKPTKAEDPVFRTFNKQLAAALLALGVDYDERSQSGGVAHVKSEYGEKDGVFLKPVSRDGIPTEKLKEVYEDDQPDVALDEAIKNSHATDAEKEIMLELAQIQGLVYIRAAFENFKAIEKFQSQGLIEIAKGPLSAIVHKGASNRTEEMNRELIRKFG